VSRTPRAMPLTTASRAKHDVLQVCVLLPRWLYFFFISHTALVGLAVEGHAVLPTMLLITNQCDPVWADSKEKKERKEKMDSSVYSALSSSDIKDPHSIKEEARQAERKRGERRMEKTAHGAGDRESLTHKWRSYGPASKRGVAVRSRTWARRAQKDGREGRKGRREDRKNRQRGDRHRSTATCASRSKIRAALSPPVVHSSSRFSHLSTCRPTETTEGGKEREIGRWSSISSHNASCDGRYVRMPCMTRMLLTAVTPDSAPFFLLFFHRTTATPFSSSGDCDCRLFRGRSVTFCE
jgi:hypothetical protein